MRYLTVKRGGKVIARRRYRKGVTRTVLSRRLSGRYRVVTYARGCIGTCRNLDPPARKCVLYVRVRSGERTTVNVLDTDYESGCPALID